MKNNKHGSLSPMPGVGLQVRLRRNSGYPEGTLGTISWCAQDGSYMVDFLDNTISRSVQHCFVYDQFDIVDTNEESRTMKNEHKFAIGQRVATNDKSGWVTGLRGTVIRYADHKPNAAINLRTLGLRGNYAQGHCSSDRDFGLDETAVDELRTKQCTLAYTS